MITVTGEIVGNGLAYSYPLKTYNGNGDLLTYVVPLYRVTVTGPDGSSRDFSAIRFGVSNTATTDPSIVGISNAQGPYDLQWSTRYGGSWQVMGLYNDDGVENYFVHLGPSSEYAVIGGIGCIEILGGRAIMNDMNSYINQFSGGVQINYQYAAPPPLVTGPVIPFR